MRLCKGSVALRECFVRDPPCLDGAVSAATGTIPDSSVLLGKSLLGQK